MSNNTDNRVTLVITSCNRPILLRVTILSFIKYNTYPIERCIIIDDSGGKGVNDFMLDMNLPFEVYFIYNDKNIGQIASIDKAYSYVTTPYIFHCEEDWEFYKSDFIQNSLDILHEDEKIVCVWLRKYGDSPHPVDNKIINNKYKLMNIAFYENANRSWMGFTFNPALRRKCDYDIVKPFVDACKPYNNNVGPDEFDLQKVYKNLGYYAAITLNSNGYVKHIGWTSHVKRSWEK